MTGTRRIIYVIGFAAPPVVQLDELVTMLRTRGWDTYVILSPTAETWIARDALAGTSGHHVRIEPRHPRMPDPLPPADAVIAAPLTFNSLNKWAAGISDTLALGLLNEALGGGLPMVAVACVKATLRRHPAYTPNLDRLVGAGVAMLNPDEIMSRTASGALACNWRTVVDAVRPG